MLTNPAESAHETSPPPPSETSLARRSRTGVWIAGGIALTGCIVVGVVDPNTTQLLPACAFKSATGLDCPGCGMTRGLHALLRGDVVRAIDHNALLVAILMATAAYFLLHAIARQKRKPPLRFAISRATWIVVGLVVVAFWAIRNLPLAPFDWLGSSA